ncbi:MAG: hypothetical protein ACYC0E_04375 [Acidimicrobiales bacterium]
MDHSLDVMYGPNPIQKTGMVTVPRELLREIGLDVGQRVHWMLSSEVPGSLLLVPSWRSVLAQRGRHGPVTVAKAYHLLHAICASALADELLPRNPCTVKGAAVERSA